MKQVQDSKFIYKASSRSSTLMKNKVRIKHQTVPAVQSPVKRDVAAADITDQVLQ